MTKKVKMLEVDMDENNRKIYDVDKEINTIQKAIRRRKQKDRKNGELSRRINELKNLKTDHRKKIDTLKQIILHIEEVKDEVILKIKELKKKIKNIPKENSFDFTDYVEKQKEDNEVDLGLLLELAEEKGDYTQSNTSKHSHRRYAKIDKWVFYKWLF